MKLGLENKMQTIIAGYKANCTANQEAIKAVLDPFKTLSYAARFTPEGMREEIKEQMSEVNASWKKYDITVNQAARTAVAGARDAVRKALNMKEKSKPADYSTKIANARAFLKDELDSVEVGSSGFLTADQARELDETMHLILKDFIDDYDTMKLFRKMVERKVPVTGSIDGSTPFPKTFGKMIKADSIMNTLDQLDEITESLFLHKRNGGQEYLKSGNQTFYVPEDGYSEMAEEQAASDLAVIADDLADMIDSEGVAGSATNTPVKADVISINPPDDVTNPSNDVTNTPVKADVVSTNSPDDVTNK